MQRLRIFVGTKKKKSNDPAVMAQTELRNTNHEEYLKVKKVRGGQRIGAFDCVYRRLLDTHCSGLVGNLLVVQSAGAQRQLDRRFIQPEDMLQPF